MTLSKKFEKVETVEMFFSLWFLDNINFQSQRILETNSLSSIQVKMPCVPAVMLLCSVEFTVFCQYL